MRKRALAWLLVVVRRHAYPRRVGLATGSAAAARAVTIDSGAAVQLGFSSHAAGRAGAAKVEFGRNRTCRNSRTFLARRNLRIYVSRACMTDK